MHRIALLALVLAALPALAKAPAAKDAPKDSTKPAMSVATGPELLDPNTAPATIKVTFPGLKDNVIDNATVFKGFGCTGDNKSLAIAWEGVPSDAKSLAVIIHDPDAPTGVGFFHWNVFNIPPTTTSLEKGASGDNKLPAGAVQGYTDYGMSSFGGPCPPPGPAHRYIATVYALKVAKLELDGKATPALVRFMLNGNAIALGRATATYGRAK